MRTVQNRWSQLGMPASKSEEALPPMSGHAACAVGSRIFLYGGRQGSQVRKYLRRLYIYDTGEAPLHGADACAP